MTKRVAVVVSVSFSRQRDRKRKEKKKTATAMAKAMQHIPRCCQSLRKMPKKNLTRRTMQKSSREQPCSWQSKAQSLSTGVLAMAGNCHKGPEKCMHTYTTFYQPPPSRANSLKPHIVCLDVYRFLVTCRLATGGPTKGNRFPPLLLKSLEIWREKFQALLRDLDRPL